MSDLVVVRPGGSIPADGTVIESIAEVDESMVTGESRPVRRGPGDRVAGTVATDSGLRVEVTAVGDETALAGIQRMVTEAQNSYPLIGSRAHLRLQNVLHLPALTGQCAGQHRAEFGASCDNFPNYKDMPHHFRW